MKLPDGVQRKTYELGKTSNHSDHVSVSVTASDLMIAALVTTSSNRKYVSIELCESDLDRLSEMCKTAAEFMREARKERDASGVFGDR